MSKNTLRSRYIACVVTAVCGFLLIGCPFLHIRKDIADDRWSRLVAPLALDPDEPYIDLADLNSRAEPRFDSMGLFDPTGRTFVSEFLHISDAQIRDETLHVEAGEAIQLKSARISVCSALRPVFVDKLDVAQLAAFLGAHSRSISRSTRTNERPFVMHTGDLLDISVVSEAISALATYRAARLLAPQFPVYLAAGNHDGVYFGSVPDRFVNHHDFGINRTEFVAASLLFDRPDQGGNGFGFALNEWVAKTWMAAHTAAPRIAPNALTDSPAIGNQLSALIRAGELSALPAGDRRHRVPLTLKELIKAELAADRRGETFGYYSFGAGDSCGTAPRVVHIVLDTRGVSSEGEISNAQIAWLTGELGNAKRNCQLVVLFAHHGPESLLAISKRRLGKILDRFSNIIGFFYGHKHANAEKRWRNSGFPLIQTGSMADFPQVGRKVWIEVGAPDRTGNVTGHTYWDFVRPRGNGTAEGNLLDGLLNRSCEEAKAHTKRCWYHEDPKQSVIRGCGPLSKEALLGRFRRGEVEFPEFTANLAREDIRGEDVFGQDEWAEIEASSASRTLHELLLP